APKARPGQAAIPRRRPSGEAGGERPAQLRLLAAGTGEVVGELVLPDGADVEVARLRVREVEPRDARGRLHRERLRELDAHLRRPQQLEERALDGVLRAGGIARGG